MGGRADFDGATSGKPPAGFKPAGGYAAPNGDYKPLLSRSFRLRLALWSALLAGLALAGFAAIAWWQMHAAKLDTLDRAIRDHAERELSRRHPPDHWARQEQRMAEALGVQDPRHALLLFLEGEATVYRSPHWPAGLAPEKLPWPEPGSRPPPRKGDGAPRRGTSQVPWEGTAAFPHPPPPRPDGEGPFPPYPPPPPEGAPFPPPGDPPPLPPPAVTLISLENDGVHWRFALAAGRTGRLAIGVDLAVIDAEMAQLRTAFLLATPFMLGLIGLGAWLLSGRALRPLRRLTETMSSVTVKGLDQRIPLDGEDREFTQLIQVFNDMLERLERSFLNASRFSADAAHELKTPLAILQGQIERAIAQCEDGSPTQGLLTGILDEVQRLGSISRKLLLLSLADAGRLRLNLAPYDLTQALEELVEDAKMLAPELKVRGNIAAGLIVQADVELFRQVLHNLLSNAIKYNRSDGWIKIVAARKEQRIMVAVASASDGIAEADRERIFERFYRADQAQKVEGVGLGLSLSREIMRAHGGDLVLSEARENRVQFVALVPVEAAGAV